MKGLILRHISFQNRLKKEKDNCLKWIAFNRISIQEKLVQEDLLILN